MDEKDLFRSIYTNIPHVYIYIYFSHLLPSQYYDFLDKPKFGVNNIMTMKILSQL